MDIADIASEREEEIRSKSVERLHQHTHTAGCDHCIECGELISEQRRQLVPWAIRCLACQQVFEKKHRHYR